MDFAKYNLTPPTLSDGDVLRDMQVDNRGRLLIAGGASGAQPAASSQSVTPASDGSAFPVAARTMTSIMPTYTNNTNNPVNGDSRGNIRALIVGVNQFSAATARGLTVLDMARDADSTTAAPMAALGYLYNGTQLVSQPGDITGSWFHSPPSTVSSALSGAITTSGGNAAIVMTNTTRTEVLNPSTATLWASWGTPVVNGAGSFPIVAGGTYSPPDRTAGTLTLLSTAATQPYTVNRFS